MREPDGHDFYAAVLPIEVGLCLPTGAHQVAHGLMMLVRHPHSRKFAGAQQPRQGNCITTIVLDPVTRLGIFDGATTVQDAANCVICRYNP